MTPSSERSTCAVDFKVREDSQISFDKIRNIVLGW